MTSENPILFTNSDKKNNSVKNEELNVEDEIEKEKEKLLNNSFSSTGSVLRVKDKF